jgi:hypothetical protein
LRINKRWNQQKQPKTIKQMANAIAGAIWKLSSEVVLNLENENFETATQEQRVDILEEVIIFLIHQSDRRIYSEASTENRSDFITTLSKDLARIIEDSRYDVQGEGSYQAAFFDKLNARSTEFSRYTFTEEEGASFAMRCALGNFVRDKMGNRDNKWVPDYIIGKEAPAAEIALRKTLSGLVSFDS